MLRLALVLLCWCSLPLFASTVFKGKLTGTDGKPMEKAHVHVAENMYAPPLKTVEVGKDGSYRIETDDSSPFILLQFTGSSHKMEAVPVLTKKEETVELDVRLQPNSFPKIEGVTVIGDFNEYDFSSGIVMNLQPDGTYTAEIKSDNPTVSYQVVVATGSMALRSVNGTAYDELVYDGGGDYRSVLAAKNGAVKIVFDPKRLAATATPGVVGFGAGSKHHEKFSLGAKEVENRKSAIVMIAQTAQTEEEAKAAGKELKRALEDMAARIDKESDDHTRQCLLMFYLDLANMAELSHDKPDPVVARAFREIAPDSPLWDYNPSLHYSMVFTPDSAKAHDYELAMLEASVSPKVRRSVLMALMSKGFNSDNEEEGVRYYKMLVKEFPKSSEAEYASKEFNPDRAIKKGNRVPAFSVASLDNESVTYSSENMKGKYYLIDFWATWCGPCVKEMGNLHKAYEQFKDKNFEIISLSFDGKPEDVATFRDKKWNMPWLHTFVKDGFKSDLGKAFEVGGIPKPVLIDPNGVIIATEAELRGERLLTTLAKFLEPVASEK